MPDRLQAAAVRPRDVDGGEEVGGREAGAPDDDVRLVQPSVGGPDPGCFHGRHRLGHDVHVRPGQRGVPLVREEQALAAEGVVRDQLGPEPGVPDLLPERGPPESQEATAQARVTDHRRVEALGAGEGGPATGLLGAREALVGSTVEARVGAVRLRYDVGRGPLEHHHRRHLGRDPGHELDRTRTGADDRDPLAGQVDVVAPPCGVEGGADEQVPSRELGDDRLGELADGRDEDVGLQLLAVRRTHRPGRGRVGPPGRGDGDAGAHVPADARLLGDAADVGVDLGLGRVAASPAGVGGERPGVERGGHVARSARVGVVSPDAAHVVRALEDGEIGEAGAQQLDPHAQAAEPGTDDDDARTGGVSRHGREGSGGGLVTARQTS